MHFAYLLRCADGSLYAGATNDLAAREARHNTGRGSRYVAGRRPVRIVYAEGFATLQEAMSRERDLKRLTRPEKESLVKSTRR
ncbi:MAG TPA: GIY-YIG nuclease family protein [Vicinamibacterales bacterium]|nr:GIY-YIG nuclease family protein [Vicinamibacterales bacterium]